MFFSPKGQKSTHTVDRPNGQGETLRNVLNTEFEKIRPAKAAEVSNE